MPSSYSWSRGSPPLPDLVGFDEVIATVPIAYLESYPLPAFVCCVRWGPCNPPPALGASDAAARTPPAPSRRPPLVNHDTDSTVVAHERAAWTGSSISSQAWSSPASSSAPSGTPTPLPASAALPTSCTSTSASATMTPNPSGLSGSAPGISATESATPTAPFTRAQSSSADMSRSGSTSTSAPQSSGAAWSWRDPPQTNNRTDTEQERQRGANVLPVGSQLNTLSSSPFRSLAVPANIKRTASCMWHNAQWSRVVGDTPLSAIIDPVTFAALEGWVSADIETRNDNSNVARDSTQFCLHVRGCLLTLVKTRHDRHPKGGTVWIITATSLVDRAHITQDGTEVKPVPLQSVGNQSASPVISAKGSVGSGSSADRSSESRITRGIPGPVVRRSSDTNACFNLLKTTDWAATAIGPRKNWSTEITSLVSLLFLSVTPDAIWIGDDLVGIYNDQYAQLCDHPGSFGRPMKETWSVTWEEVEPLIKRAMAGHPVERAIAPIFYQRNDRGRFIEKHHSFSLQPIFDRSGKVLGVWNPTQDHTDTVLAERRLATSSRLVEEVAYARTSHELFQLAAATLSHNPIDAPFVMLYSVKSAINRLVDGVPVDLELSLQASVGTPSGHPSAAERLHFRGLALSNEGSLIGDEVAWGSLYTDASAKPDNGSYKIGSRAGSGSGSAWSGSGGGSVRNRGSSPALSVRSGQSRGSARSMLSSAHSRASSKRRVSSTADNTAWPIRRALESRQAVLVDHIHDLISGFPVRYWDELPDQAIVVPLTNADNRIPQGVMILGLNLRRPFDANYEEWVNMMRGYLGATLGAVSALEEDERLREDMEKLERAKSAWFCGAAHEFRTPLTLVLGPLEEILQTSLTSYQKKQLQLAHQNISRLDQFMSSLLDFTRLEAGKAHARFVETDLAEFVTEIAGVFRFAFEKFKILLTVDTETHDVVCVDPVLLEIVVTHLILIALKLTEQGTVSVRLAYTHDRASIIVSDSGSGISEADLANATDLFRRIQTAENRGSEATGVGLALIREIMRLHNGKLFIKSKTAKDGRGSGTVFTASFPLNNEANVDTRVSVPYGVYAKHVARDIQSWDKDGASDDLGNVDTSSTSSGRSDASTGRGLSADISGGLLFEREDVLLVVDNNAEMRGYIKALFERFCTVVEASSAGEALEVTRHTHPSLVISELVLRNMSGIDLLNELRLDEALRFVPMVLLSSTTDDEERVAAFLAGVDDFISKPFKPRELLLRVHLHMQMGKKRAKLEQLFAQRELELSVLSDYCPSGIMRTDEEGRVIYANESFRNPAGMTPNSMAEVDWRWWEYCDDESRPRVEQTWNDILTGVLPATSLQWKWQTGRTMSAVVIRLDVVRPGMSGLLMCVTDISYQEERIEEEQRRRLEAEESKHQQELLVDLTSHEIRTPVSAILQCSSLVKENLVALKEQLRLAGPGGFKPSPTLLSDLEEDVEALESIYQCGLVQERIAGDVLSLARIQLDMLSMHYVEMDLRKEAKKVLSVFASEAKMKKIEIALEVGPSLDALQLYSVKTDPVRLGQVLTNLTANAIRFTANASMRKITVRYDVSLEPPLPGTLVPPPGAPGTPVVVPLPEDMPVYLFVSVTDTGPGMTAEEQGMLFRRFQQGNKMIHTRYGGSGLGLFICKKITELLGGAIATESQVGVGSTFRFWIKTHTVSPTPSASSSSRSQTPPRMPDASLIRPSTVSDNASLPAPSPGLPLPLREEPTPPQPAPEELPETPSETKLHLLIVEDNIINQTVLKRQLVKAAFECDTANDGQEALVHIHEANRASRTNPDNLRGYDVVLMDLEMPVMDGLTAIRHIRDAERQGTLRPQLVIALTGNARQGQIDQAMAAGMDDVVIKPYHLPSLLEKIRAAVLVHRERCADSDADGEWHSQRLRLATPDTKAEDGDSLPPPPKHLPPGMAPSTEPEPHPSQTLASLVAGLDVSPDGDWRNEQLNVDDAEDTGEDGPPPPANHLPPGMAPSTEPEPLSQTPHGPSRTTAPGSVPNGEPERHNHVGLQPARPSP